MTRPNEKVIFLDYTINSKYYNLIWANKADLDYAEIVYTIDGKTGEAIKLDAKNNKILYTEGPLRDYSAKYRFIDINGNEI